MLSSSILTKEAVETYLRVARQNLERDGFLTPALFVHSAEDQTLIMPLNLPDTFEKKAQHFTQLGRYLHKQAIHLTEAVLLCETWFVAVREAPAAMDFLPSEHPSRQEAIVAIGRNVDNSRYTHVVQPYTRTKDNHPVWQAIPLAMYDQARSDQSGPVGILDYLFTEVSVNA